MTWTGSPTNNGCSRTRGGTTARPSARRRNGTAVRGTGKAERAGGAPARAERNLAERGHPLWGKLTTMTPDQIVQHQIAPGSPVSTRRPPRSALFQLGIVCGASFVVWAGFGAILPY